MSDLSSKPHSEGGIDRSLLEWFASLTPEQRLAEMESRVSFFLSLDRNEDLIDRSSEVEMTVGTFRVPIPHSQP